MAYDLKEKQTVKLNTSFRLGSSCSSLHLQPLNISTQHAFLRASFTFLRPNFHDLLLSIHFTRYRLIIRKILRFDLYQLKQLLLHNCTVIFMPFISAYWRQNVLKLRFL